jgi:hypothetical protein
MAWPSANISLSNVDADSDSISSARADIYQAFTSLNDIIQVGPGSGSGSGGFSGNLFGNTLVDSVNGRILANASPQQNVTQISTYTQGVVVTTAPVYTGANLTMNNQTIGMAIAGNVNFLTSWAAGTRTTNLNTAYLGVTAVSANTSMNANDRFRAYGGSIDMNLNGKNWGLMSSTSQNQFPVLINGQTMNIYGTGTVGQAAAISNAVVLVPVNGSISAQYVTGYNTGLQYSTAGGGYTASNIQYARLYTGTVSGMTGNLTVNNAIALHTISGWVSSNVSLVNNAYVILNEDARSVIQTAGNIVSTGNLIQTSGNIIAGNVTSTNGYFWANGAAYASGSGTYANTNVGAYLAAGISSNIVTTGTGNQYGTMRTFNEQVVALGNVSGVTTVNMSLGSVQTMTLTGNITINTTDIVNAVAGSTATLIIKQDATGSRILTSNLSYPSGNCTLSTPANSIDTIRVLYDGENYLGRIDRAYAAIPTTSTYLIVAGGGGGAGSTSGLGYPGAGGGAGGVIAGTINLTSGTTYTITVGAGGTATANGATAGSGSNSSAFSLTAIGGGGGAGNEQNGLAGGSGGGGYGYPNLVHAGGAGTAGQGTAGGYGYSDDATYTNSGGGGGAGATATTGNVSYGGKGGTGIVSTITGTSVYYGGGGGGSTGNPSYPTSVATGGAGGGGNGSTNFDAGGTTGATAGTVNTGGGGGGGCAYTGGAGGSGVVILAVPTARYTGTKTGSPTVTTSGAYTILKFTASGSYTA